MADRDDPLRLFQRKGDHAPAQEVARIEVDIGTVRLDDDGDPEQAGDEIASDPVGISPGGEQQVKGICLSYRADRERQRQEEQEAVPGPSHLRDDQVPGMKDVHSVDGLARGNE
jgi:hypothetical protein